MLFCAWHAPGNHHKALVHPQRENQGTKIWTSAPHNSLGERHSNKAPWGLLRVPKKLKKGIKNKI